MIQRKQRVPMRDLSTMTAEDREAVEKNSMNGRIFNIFKVLAHHPKLVKRWTPFAGHILGKQTLPFRDRELLILRIGWLNQAEYEFAQHELIARKGRGQRYRHRVAEGRPQGRRLEREGVGAAAGRRRPVRQFRRVGRDLGDDGRSTIRPSSSWTRSSPSASTTWCRGRSTASACRSTTSCPARRSRSSLDRARRLGHCRCARSLRMRLQRRGSAR